jgi:hypothetical protein
VNAHRYWQLLTLFGALLIGVWPGRAGAQAKFTRNNYALDLFTSPVLGGSRIVGMGGAYTAIASGIDGAAYNPAGYAERYEKEIDWFAFDITGGLSLSGVFTKNDFDNNGSRSSTSGNTYQLTLGVRMQFSYLGTGVSWLQRRYNLKGEDNRSFDVVLDTWRTGAGYSFLNGGLVAGVTLSIYKFAVANSSGGGDPLTSPVTPFRVNKDPTGFTGMGAEFGVLVRPAGERYRLGFVARTGATARLDAAKKVTDPDGVRRAQGLVLPSHIHVPWELAFGVAYQFGERRTNTPWRNTNELRAALAAQIADGSYQMPERYHESPYQALPSDPEQALDVAMANYREAERRFRRHQPRRYVLVSGDVIASGHSANAHGIDAFLNQTPERSGQNVSYGVRLGMESEVWPDRMKVRGGTYLEPSRFGGSYYRPHATTGFDVRLFDVWRWSARGTATADLAPRYFNWGIAFGLWW